MTVYVVKSRMSDSYLLVNYKSNAYVTSVLHSAYRFSTESEAQKARALVCKVPVAWEILPAIVDPKTKKLTLKKKGK